DRRQGARMAGTDARPGDPGDPHRLPRRLLHHQGSGLPGGGRTGRSPGAAGRAAQGRRDVTPPVNPHDPSQPPSSPEGAPSADPSARPGVPPPGTAPPPHPGTPPSGVGPRTSYGS